MKQVITVPESTYDFIVKGIGIDFASKTASITVGVQESYTPVEDPPEPNPNPMRMEKHVISITEVIAAESYSTDVVNNTKKLIKGLVAAAMKLTEADLTEDVF